MLGLIIVIIIFALFLLSLYIKCKERNKWIIIYEGQVDKAYARFSLLKENGVICKIKDYTEKSMYTNALDPLKQSTMAVFVDVKHEQKAIILLNEFNNNS
ncbi:MULTISPECIES: hypothetical protein [Brevibacillus]|uniref:hypothetical protein n=1 Tax=Brevibacillus TaxID=55080 RepID=UPI000B9A7BE3|nr:MULTISPECIES: hypothetical protein [Brevibacillus]RFB35839.1 hypothetical protein DZB91_05970 [Brevibacillus sp. VP]